MTACSKLDDLEKKRIFFFVAGGASWARARERERVKPIPAAAPASRSSRRFMVLIVRPGKRNTSARNRRRVFTNRSNQREAVGVVAGAGRDVGGGAVDDGAGT